MTVVASLRIADVGVRTALGVLRKQPKPGSIDGLRHANTAIAAPLSESVRPAPTFKRVGLFAIWEDEAALDRFQAEHLLAAKLADGWRVRLQPLRASGSWPGLPNDIPAARSVDHDGPALVLTLGWLRISQGVRFLRSSARAEGAVLQAPGVILATGLARPPFVSTCSVWESSRALMTYAYGRDQPAHMNAIDADQAKPFHRQSAFVRFRPYASHGSLGGSNALAERWMQDQSRTAVD